MCIRAYLCGFATKITYLAQVAQMFTFFGFLCTGETDSFPETKKNKNKNVEILHETNCACKHYYEIERQ